MRSAWQAWVAHGYEVNLGSVVRIGFMELFSPLPGMTGMGECRASIDESHGRRLGRLASNSIWVKG